MASESFLLRVQSSEGTKRLSVSSHDTGRTLYEKIHDAFGLGSFDFRLYMDRARTRELVSTGRKTLTSFGLKHGDMLFMSCGTECTISDPPRGPVVAPAGDEKSQPVSDKPDSKSSATKLVDVQEAPVSIVEDEVDVQLSKTDGKIQRPRDPSHCRHNVKSQCVHCFPLDPWDEGYIKSNGIKHMSFNAYLRKLQSGMDKGKFVALENMDCSIKPDCPNHPPWPKALCSQCTPPAITLTRQKYRHVDHIMVENASIVDRFLDYWRTAGNQRLGFLYGYYEPHDAVPLGIRAVVTAIYEPPQDSTHEHINFQPDPKVGVVDYIASGLGLRRIGWIFTDLMPEDRQTGTVQSLRNLESHLLSAQEAITSAYFQNLHPNPCRFAREGFFGSKFVTVCVSGNEEKQIHLNGYQISDQGMGLVKYECLVPTRDIPQLAYVLESSMQKYVPDVFYRMKDKYGNHITRIARPLPIEYLLLDVPLSTPVDPQYTLTAAKVVAAPPSRGATRTAFPVENRLLDRDIQDLSALGRYLRQFQTPEEKMDALNDLHVLVFLATCDTLPLSPPQEKLLGLLSGLRARDATAVQAWMSGDDWQTVEQLLEAVAGSPSPTPPPVSQQPQRQPSNSSAAATVSRPTPEVAPEPPIPPPERMDDSPPPAETWTCTHCTFINHSVLDSCEVCGLPKDQ